MSSIAPAAPILLITFWQMLLSHRQSKQLLSHCDVVPVPFRGYISTTSARLACAYNLDRQRLRRLSILVDASLVLLLTAGGCLSGLWLALAELGNDTLRSAVFITLLAGLMRLAHLPLSLLHTFWLEEKHGFNSTTLTRWLSDQLKQLLLLLMITVPPIWALSLLWQQPDIQRVWYFWLIWSGINLFAAWAYPVLLAPLFFRFTPLNDQNLAAAIQAMFAANHLPATPVFVMNGSSRSSHGNAFFSGLGNSRRIVIFDTLLARLTPDEIVAVLAHEIGHQQHGHLRKGVLLSLLSSGVFLLLLWQASIAPVISQLAGIATPHPVPAAMLCLFVLPYLAFPLLPFRNWLSRRAEYQADSFAARIWPARHLISALIKLYRDNASTLHADPLHSVFYDTHPSALLRINHLESKAHESAGNEMRSTAGTAKR